jgi:hypothetical protein
MNKDLSVFRFFDLGPFERVVIWIGTRPAASRLIEAIASQSAGTTVRKDARGLFGQKCRRVNNIGFQRHLFACTIAI